MSRGLQFQKVELSDAAQRAIYKALEEREDFSESNKTEDVHPRQWLDLYRCKWSDSASHAETKWREVFEELEASRSHTDPEFLLPPAQTFDLAKGLLQLLKLNRSITAPEITLDGDGNLYLEWNSGNKRLSICLSDNLASNYIYLGVGREYNAYPLTLKNLREAIDS